MLEVLGEVRDVNCGGVDFSEENKDVMVGCAWPNLIFTHLSLTFISLDHVVYRRFIQILCSFYNL